MGISVLLISPGSTAFIQVISVYVENSRIVVHGKYESFDSIEISSGKFPGLLFNSTVSSFLSQLLFKLGSANSQLISAFAKLSLATIDRDRFFREYLFSGVLSTFAPRKKSTRGSEGKYLPHN